MNPTPAQIASRFACSPEQVRAQFRKNATHLRSMEARARQTGRKVNKYTADQLAALAERAERQCVS